jgi:hypothetical protein
MNEIALLTRYSHEYTEDTLRCKLHESLRNILLLAQVGTKWPDTESISIDKTSDRNTFSFNDYLLRCNLEKIDWDNICSQYDSICNESNSLSRASRTTTKSTILGVLLDTFSNPLIWPNACITSTFRVLLETMLYVRSSVFNERALAINGTNEQMFSLKMPDWTPSQHKILNYLTEVLRRNRSMQSISFWTTDNTTWLLNRVSTGYHGEIVLRILRLWFVEFPDCALLWISLLSKVIAALDIAEASLIQNLKNNTGEKERAKQEQLIVLGESNNRKRPIGHSSFDFQKLHGESCFENLYTEHISKSQSLHAASSSDYFRVVQDTRTQGDTVANNILKLWKAKAMCVEFIATCSRRISFRWCIQKPIPFLSGPKVTILHELFDSLCAQPNAITLKLSCILVAKAIAHDDSVSDSLDFLLSVIWWRATTERSIDDVEIFTQFYCELIIACSRYNCLECLTKAIMPMIVTITESVDSLLLQSPSSREALSNYDKQREIHKQRIYRKSFAIILSVRGKNLATLLNSRSTQQHAAQLQTIKALITNLITNVSVLFDQPNDWIEPDLSSQDRYRIILGLQQAGIVGLDVVNSVGENCKARKKAHHLVSIDDLARVFEIIYQNIDPWLSGEWKYIDLFSCCDGTKPTYQPSMSIRRTYNCAKGLNTGVANKPCILLRDAILHIFSFLSYRRLVRIRLVCTEWKDLSDNRILWHMIYIRRYKNLSTCKVSEKFKLDWKKMFMERQQAVRNIKYISSRNNRTWRIRICHHVNCLAVLKSRNAAEKHLRKHNQQAQKQRNKS